MVEFCLTGEVVELVEQEVLDVSARFLQRSEKIIASPSMSTTPDTEVIRTVKSWGS